MPTIVHCHTWYAHFGGILAKILYGIPLVITVHSLEPLRPWKREQIGRGYDLSSWVEKTALEMADAVIAVSSSTRDDILRLFDVDTGTPARSSPTASTPTNTSRSIGRTSCHATASIPTGRTCCSSAG